MNRSKSLAARGVRVFLGVVGSCFLVLLIAAILFPIFAQAKTGRRYSCMSKVKGLSTAMFIYSGDWDDRMPPPEKWTTAIIPRVRRESYFHCDALEDPNAFAYAFNSELGGRRQVDFKNVETVPMIYDSSTLTANANDRVTSLPIRGRHSGFNLVVYADGHAAKVLGAVPK